MPLDYRYLKQDIGGECNFDRITQEANGDYSIGGWAISSANAQSIARTLIISIEMNGSAQFGVMEKQERSDVAQYFNNKQLIGAGFFGRFKKSDLPIGACINIHQIFNSFIMKCKKNLRFDGDRTDQCQ